MSIHKKTRQIILTGLMINYPMNILVIWFLLDVMRLSSTWAIATCTSVIFTLVSYTRVYAVLYLAESKVNPLARVMRTRRTSTKRGKNNV